MAKAMQLDFTNVKDGGTFNKRHQPPGDYPAKILKVETVSKKDDKKKKMWLWTIKVGGGTYPYYTAFEENQLWKIRNLFVAAGITVPKKRMNVDPNKIVGKTIGVTLEDEEYNDKLQSVIQATFPASELEQSVDVTDDDEDDDDEDDEEEESEDDEDDDSDDEDDDEDEDDDSDADDEDSDEEDEDDDDEEEPEPPKKKTKKAAAKKTKGKKGKASKVDDDELEELDIEDI